MKQSMEGNEYAINSGFVVQPTQLDAHHRMLAEASVLRPHVELLQQELHGYGLRAERKEALHGINPNAPAISYERNVSYVCRML